MTLLVVNAGGTISAVRGSDGVLHGAADPRGLTASLPDHLGSVREVTAYRGLSEDMTFSDVMGLLDAIRQGVAGHHARRRPAHRRRRT
jgi:L-asparaginase/Glu-tRNA(Gln) amidotransferase subunit D